MLSVTLFKVAPHRANAIDIAVSYASCSRRQRIFQPDALQFPIIVCVFYYSSNYISCQINVAVLIIIYSEFSAAAGIIADRNNKVRFRRSV